MVKTEDLRFQYTPERSFNFPDIHVEKGQQLCVLGPSGKGKTTLLHLLAGLLKARNGKVMIEGQDLSELKGASLDAYRAKHIGIVFQVPHFIASISLLENIRLTMHLGNKHVDESSIQEKLEALGLSHRKDALPSQMSQGELQRASIIRGTINNPDLVLADEPTSSLDDANAERVMQLLLEQSREVNAALILVTHDARVKQHISKSILL